MDSKGHTRFWPEFALRMEAFARLLSVRCSVQLQSEPSDFAQTAMKATFAFLLRRYGIDAVAQPLSPEIAEIALFYALKCTRNALITEVRRIEREARAQAATPQFHEPLEGIFDLSIRKTATPEEMAIANDLVRRAASKVSKGRRDRVSAALQLIVDEGGNGNLSKDLTDLAGISANDLAYERKRLRTLLKD